MSPERYTLWVGLWVIVAGVALRLSAAMLPGVTVTSWWRSPWRNAAVGGAVLSRHQVGLAVDLSPASPGVLALARRVYGWLPLAVVVDEGDHIHVQVT